MKPIGSADGEEISWLNYKTGNKHIAFKMEVDSRQAQIAIVVYHPEPDTQSSYVNRLSQLKRIFEEAVGEDDWSWEPNTTDEQGWVVSVVQKTLSGVNLFKNEDLVGHHFVPKTTHHRPGQLLEHRKLSIPAFLRSALYARSIDHFPL